MSNQANKEQALEALRKYYGYSDFRTGQWEAISALLEGRDTVVLMPTGGGKSLCFQLPALISEGCCLVVSPLIALMNDQVSALRANGLPAGAVNSMRMESDNRATYEAAARGELKLLYISPERLLQDLEIIARTIRISFIAVDEAHCISQWGHDFRPVYTDLRRLKEQWPGVPVMALTATADRLTREDISGALGLKEPFMYVGSFDRPNLSLTVINGSTQKDRLRVISGLVSKYPMDCGIVYCLSRKKTETMAEKLKEMGIRVGAYHAGMTSTEREMVQRDFVSGRLQAICATIAFGMGIDKSNVRWVVHNNIPGNIESYYQEIGRAGRDGLPAETILFYSYGDIITRRNFVEESGQVEINSSKLDFMQKYAEASVCRRRILLSYFSEEATEDCGNCDNCRNPRPRFDGSILVQKALSAIVRVGSSEGINVIVEILRGMSRQYILDKQYNLLPTYGVGRDLGAQEWHAYILQMIQLGLIEVAYEDRFHLRPTPAGMKVLRGQRTIELARHSAPLYSEFTTRRNRKPEPAPADTRTPAERMTDALKLLRAELAAKEGLADYMVFSDVTIAGIVSRQPELPKDLVGIEGMSLVKIGKYWKEILMKVREAKGEKKTLPKGLSDHVSGLLFSEGMTVEAIAEARGYAVTTIVGHLCRQYQDGEPIDLWRIVPETTYQTVKLLIDTYKAQGVPTRVEPDSGSGNVRTLSKILSEDHGIPYDLYSRVVSIRSVLEPQAN